MDNKSKKEEKIVVGSTPAAISGGSRMSRFVALKKIKAGTSTKIDCDAAAAVRTPDPIEAVESSSLDTSLTSRRPFLSTGTEALTNEWGSDSDREQLVDNPDHDDNDAIAALEISMLERSVSSLNRSDGLDDQEIRRRALLRHRSGRKWKMGSHNNEIEEVATVTSLEDPQSTTAAAASSAIAAGHSAPVGEGVHVTQFNKVESSGGAAEHVVEEGIKCINPSGTMLNGRSETVEAGVIVSNPPCLSDESVRATAAPGVSTVSSGPSVVYRARGPSERSGIGLSNYHIRKPSVNIESTADFPDLGTALSSTASQLPSETHTTTTKSPSSSSNSGQPSRPIYRSRNILTTLTESIGAKRASSASNGFDKPLGVRGFSSHQDINNKSISGTTASSIGRVTESSSKVVTESSGNVTKGENNNNNNNKVHLCSTLKFEDEAFSRLVSFLSNGKNQNSHVSSYPKISFNIERSREKYFERPPYNNPLCS